MTDPLRVLYVHRQKGASVGGSLRALGRTVSYMRGRGDVLPELLFTLDAQEIPGAEGVPASRLPLPAARKAKSIPRYPSAVARLCAFLRGRRPGVIHLNDLDETILFLLATRIGPRIPLVATARSFLDSPARFRKLLAHRLDRVVCVSEAVRRQAIEAGVSPGRAPVVHDPIDPRWGEPVPPEAAAAWGARLGIPDGAPVIGTVGNVAPVKGTDLLIRALPPLVRRFPGLRCVVVGADDGGWRPELVRLAESLGVSGCLTFTGPLPDPQGPLARMDVFVLPSRLEGYGLVLLEAMSCARPVVASRVGGVPDIVPDDSVGLLVPPEEPEAIAAAVASLLASPALRAGMGGAAQRRVRESFLGDAQLAKLAALYRELAGEPRAGAR